MTRLVADYRRGGKLQWVILGDGETLNLVPDEVRSSVVFVCSHKDGEYEPQGTAFLVAYTGSGSGEMVTAYMVTARHVIDGIRNVLPTLGKGDGRVFLRMNVAGGKATYVSLGDELPKDEESDPWVFHPSDDEYVDAAVMHWVPPQPLECGAIIENMFADEEKRRELQHVIGLGSEVFMTGLFVNHAGRDRNEPILRTGNIAAIPADPVLTTLGPMRGILVEARSIGGLSGSPVFTSVPLAALKSSPPIAQGSYDETEKTFTVYFLLGLMRGHWDVDLAEAGSKKKEAVNMGIGIVVPIEKVVEILESPIMKKRRREEISKVRGDTLPTEDMAAPDRSTLDATADLMHDLMKVPKTEADEVHRNHQS